MLQDLRDNSKGVVSAILIGVLVIIFALTGVDALFTGDSATSAVVNVNGDKISENDIIRATESQRRRIIESYGESVPAEFLSDEQLRNPAIENLIQRTLLVQAANDSGLAVSDEVLNQQIVSTPQFQTEGKFDPNLYQLMLRNINFTPAAYKKALTDDALVYQLNTGILNTSFVTQAEVDNIVALNFQTRDYSYVILPAEKVRESVTVDDAEVQAYYDSNAAEFTNPEEVAVDYIDLSVDDLMADVEISEAVIRQQYEQNLESFVAAPQIQAAHILIASDQEQLILEVSEKLAAGEDFAALAAQYSEDLGSREQGGDLGFTTGDTFPEEFESALKALSVGDVSDPVVTDAGTHFIKKLAERGVEAPSFEEESKTIADQLKRAEAENTFVTLLDGLRDRSYNAENLAEVASELGLTHKNTGFFSRAGGQGIASENLFVSAAFSPDVLEQGNSSEVIELTPSRVVVLKKTDYKASSVSPIDAVKEQIVTRIREQRTRELLAAQAAKLKAELDAGKALADLAQESNLEVVERTGATRNDPEAQRDVLRHVFTMAKPQNTAVIDAVPTSSGDFALILLNAVTLGGDTLPEEQRKVIAAQLSGISGQNEYRSYQKLLRDNAEIKR